MRVFRFRRARSLTFTVPLLALAFAVSIGCLPNVPVESPDGRYTALCLTPRGAYYPGLDEEGKKASTDLYLVANTPDDHGAYDLWRVTDFSLEGQPCQVRMPAFAPNMERLCFVARREEPSASEGVRLVDHLFVRDDLLAALDPGIARRRVPHPYPIGGEDAYMRRVYTAEPRGTERAYIVYPVFNPSGTRIAFVRTPRSPVMSVMPDDRNNPDWIQHPDSGLHGDLVVLDRVDGRQTVTARTVAQNVVPQVAWLDDDTLVFAQRTGQARGERRWTCRGRIARLNLGTDTPASESIWEGWLNRFLVKVTTNPAQGIVAFDQSDGLNGEGRIILLCRADDGEWSATTVAEGTGVNNPGFAPSGRRLRFFKGIVDQTARFGEIRFAPPGDGGTENGGTGTPREGEETAVEEENGDADAPPGIETQLDVVLDLAGVDLPMYRIPLVGGATPGIALASNTAEYPTEDFLTLRNRGLDQSHSLVTVHANARGARALQAETARRIADSCPDKAWILQEARRFMDPNGLLDRDERLADGHFGMVFGLDLTLYTYDEEGERRARQGRYYEYADLPDRIRIEQQVAGDWSASAWDGDVAYILEGQGENAHWEVLDPNSRSPMRRVPAREEATKLLEYLRLRRLFLLEGVDRADPNERNFQLSYFRYVHNVTWRIREDGSPDNRSLHYIYRRSERRAPFEDNWRVEEYLLGFERTTSYGYILRDIRTASAWLHDDRESDEDRNRNVPPMAVRIDSREGGRGDAAARLDFFVGDDGFRYPKRLVAFSVTTINPLWGDMEFPSEANMQFTADILGEFTPPAQFITGSPTIPTGIRPRGLPDDCFARMRWRFR